MNVLITGGTKGIGKELARRLESEGHDVMTVGSGQADLSSLAATDALARAVGARFASLDALVLGAFRYNPGRVETTEGFEHTWALYVLSRFLLAQRLRPLLERASRPVIVNLCGTGGSTGRIHWDDVQLRRRYSGFRATMQGARANDLLALAGPPIRYVLYNPLFVRTAMAEHLAQPWRAVVKTASAVLATPVERAAPPILELLTNPPDSPVSAFRAGRRIGVMVDPAASGRLRELVESHIARVLR
ncbi:SDR family NAD(P)-dependent oxidoreductase [Allorhizocola rhizosphaerae]|uniref:SDR family NAD(P)-dependent oxidoreductase n=1 Tax=Allorhizocola rhizosphaerae TaxID=1872709 RepID=UPI000E3EB345|nr:SDR family NAD(P)-dependent oxidoreductase [Allorhizocola rhizosphaerae]